MLTIHQAMETDDKKEDGKPKTRKVKKQVRKGDLPIVAGTTALDTNTKNLLMEQEASMIMEDKLVADTDEKKNELETYIYELRGKLDEQYADFASEEEKEKIKTKLTESEVSVETKLRMTQELTRNRTGYTKTARMPRRLCMWPRWTRSAPWLVPSRNDISRRSRPIAKLFRPSLTPRLLPRRRRKRKLARLPRRTRARRTRTRR